LKIIEKVGNVGGFGTFPGRCGKEGSPELGGRGGTVVIKSGRESQKLGDSRDPSRSLPLLMGKGFWEPKITKFPGSRGDTLGKIGKSLSASKKKRGKWEKKREIGHLQSPD